MRILVTGAAGFIGYHTVVSLLKLGHEIVGIDNLNDYYNVDLKKHRQEIKDMQEVIISSIDGATIENVTITDNYGVVLNDFTDDENMDNRLR